MMRRVFLLWIIFPLFFFSGCVNSQFSHFQPPESHGVLPWTEQEFLNDPENFQFAIVSDRSGRIRVGVFRAAVDRLNLLQPEFVLSVGDLISGYTEDQSVLEQQYDEMDDILSKLEMRFFRVAGNHDITNPVMLEMYRERYGEPYYHFLYKDVLFLVVSTKDPPGKPKDGYISSSQADYMKRVLNDHKEVRWTFVFMHHPLFLGKNSGWEEIENALADRPHTVFTGHWHNYAKYRKHGQSYFRLATTGGGSRLRGLAAGEFDHIVWVTMTDEGPRIVNLMLGGIYDENVRVAD